jgi:hypothetical protein
LRQVHRFADFFHAAEHRADGQELRIESVGHQPRNRRLAHTRRSPEQATVRLPRLKGHAQCHAFTQDVLLANHLGQGARSKPFGQRGVVAGGLVHGAMLRVAPHPRPWAAQS